MELQEYLTVPLAAQQVHDQSLQGALANQTRIDALPWHMQERDKLQGELDQEIDSLTGEIQERGIIDMPVSRRLMDLRNKREELFGQGSRGAKIQGALQQRQQLEERWNDLVDKGERSSLQKQRALQAFDKQSQQLFQEGNIGYSGRILSPEVEMTDRVADVLRKIPMKTIEQETGWFKDSQNGLWRKRGTEISQRGTPEELFSYASKYLRNDPEVMNYLQDEAFLTETLSERDEMGNVLYNGKSYNPDEFRTSLINDRILEASRTGAGMAYDYDETTTEDIRNMSEAQMYGDMVSARLANPIFRDAGFNKNPFYNEKEIEASIDPTSTINKKIVDSEGNMMSREDFRNMALEQYKKTKSTSDEFLEGEGIGTFNTEEIYKAADHLYDLHTQGSRVDKIIPSIKMLFSNFYDKDSQTKLLKAINVGDYKAVDLSKEDKQQLQQEANKLLTPELEDYNRTVPGNERIDLDRYKKLKKETLKDQAEILNKTVDRNIPSTDLVSREISDGNLSPLQGKSLLIKKNGEEVETGSSEKTLTQLSSMIQEGADVTESKRIIQGPMVGGRVFQVQTDDGNIYEIQTEPLSNIEENLFLDDERVASTLFNPIFYGKGEYQGGFPHPSNSDWTIQYQPVKEWRNGELSSGVNTRIVDNEGNVVQESDMPIGLRDFYQHRERIRQPYYEQLYKEDYLIRKSQPGQ